VSAVLSIIVIMFLINEGFFLAEGKKEYEEGKEVTISGRVVPVYLLRIAAFGVCFVLNMTSSFLSVYTSSFWSAGLGISESMAGAVPLFANGVFSALSALFCPKLMEKTGFKGLAAAGILCSGAGDLLAGLSRNYPSIVLALLLNGLGFGILINSISITIGRIDSGKDREAGYAGFNAGCVAGINCGMIVGSILVSFIEYHQVFFITSTLWLSLIFLFWTVGRYIPESMPAETVERVRGRISPSALLYSVCVVMPYAAAGSFMYYYLPILVTSGGYSEEYVSLLMMIYAVCGIFLGQTLAPVLWTKLGRRSVLLAIVLALSGWEIIALYPALSMVALAMFFIGVSFSFGVNVMMNAFLSQRGVAQMGQDMAVGVYEFASRTGQCVSPLICSALMGMGFAYGIGVFAAGCILLYYIITFMSGRSEGEGTARA
ncbi:MAG: MFS transporter, partial [Sarcina sp.]|nr:MFS transporter [Sarcina sp.]